MNTGVIFDSHMNFDEHVKNICTVAFYYIRKIAKIRTFLSYDTVKTLMHAFVTSRIDSRNALLFDLPDVLIQRLRYVFELLLVLRNLIISYAYWCYTTTWEISAIWLAESKGISA